MRALFNDPYHWKVVWERQDVNKATRKRSVFFSLSDDDNL